MHFHTVLPVIDDDSNKIK